MNHSIRAVLIRTDTPSDQEKQTNGTLLIFDDVHVIYEAKTLELPWLDNKRNISCIPADDYIVRKRKAEESPSRDYDHFIVEDVPNRSYILWHAGNFHWHIKGCLLMGSDFADINSDGLLDVVNTRFTIDQLYKLLPERFPFKIIEI